MEDADSGKRPGFSLVIAGSRGLDPTIEEIDAALLQCDLTWRDVGVVVSGGADGVDQAGERWAGHRALEVVVYPPDWKKYGKAGGMFRNREMAEACDAGLVFWDGKSSGSANMIANLCALRKPVWVVEMKPQKKEPSRLVLPSGNR